MITDSTVQTALRTTVLNGLVRYGQPSISVVQNFQSTKQEHQPKPVQLE